MLKRCYRAQESLVRYWAQQAVVLCDDIDDESLADSKSAIEQSIERMGKDRKKVSVYAVEEQ